MKKDLLIVGLLIGMPALVIGAVAVWQATRPEDAPRAAASEPVAHLAKQPEIKAITAPLTLKSKPEQNRPKDQPVPKIEAKVTPPPEKKIEPKIEVKKEIEAKKEIKPEPKIEVKKEIKPEPKIEAKIEPRNDEKKLAAGRVIILGNDIKLNDPDGQFDIKPINGGEKIIVQGKIKTLTVAGLNDKSILDATLLDAGEILFTGNLNSGSTVLLGKAGKLRLRDVNDHSTVDGPELGAKEIEIAGAINGGSSLKLHAPAGGVQFLGDVNDGARIDIAAPDGKVRFHAPLNNVARLQIIAKSVELDKAVNGSKSEIDVTLTKPGFLQFSRLNGTVRLQYRKADAGDPEPRIDAGMVGAGRIFARCRRQRNNFDPGATGPVHTIPKKRAGHG